MPDNDLDRLRTEYARRSNSGADRSRYSLFNKANYFALQQRQRTLLQLLAAHGIDQVDNKKVLEVGCGRGGVLAEYLGYGVPLGNLTGIDLLFDRLQDAQHKFATNRAICANGQHLPFSTGQFDLVLQYTAFSSVLDDQIKADMATEMLRVLKPAGLVIWYDFWLNPSNPQTRGIRKQEIRQLFPNCEYDFRRVTLAPPIARRLIPVSLIAGHFLEKLQFLNTHFLVLIKPKRS